MRTSRKCRIRKRLTSTSTKLISKRTSRRYSSRQIIRACRSAYLIMISRSYRRARPTGARCQKVHKAMKSCKEAMSFWRSMKAPTSVETSQPIFRLSKICRNRKGPEESKSSTWTSFRTLTKRRSVSGCSRQHKSPTRWP